MEATAPDREPSPRSEGMDPTTPLQPTGIARPTCQAWSIDPGVAARNADEAEETVAFLTLGPAAQEACTIMRDPRTANVFAAWIDETRRKEWVAAAPPDHCEGSASVRECTLRRRFRVDGLSGETVLAHQFRSGRVHGLASRGRPWGAKDRHERRSL